jgi:fructan beta-fructosidase
MKKLNLFFLIIFAILILTNCKNEAEITDTNQQEEVSKIAFFEDQHRPQFHFSPKENWMNNPNGMVYYDGEYHLFYQYHPESTVSGPMHWGHAVSKDMVKWAYLPIALEPDKLGQILSGSVIIDWKNTTGFGSEEKPAMVAMYTYHDMEGEKLEKHDFETQGLAYSTDKGRTWTKYEGNPVLPNTESIHNFQDPKVFWHEVTGKWVMVLAANDKVKIYNSDDLKSWNFASDFGVEEGSQARSWECPDLFELKAADGKSKWVMLVSTGNKTEITAPNGGTGTQYFVGDFDGKTFTNSSSKETTLWLDNGTDNHAGVTWSDVPEKDGRRLFIGWMSNWDYAQEVPTEKWRGAMTIARTLELENRGGAYRLITKPVKELQILRGKYVTLDGGVLGISQSVDLEFSPSQSEVILEFNPERATHPFGVRISNSKSESVIIAFDKKMNGFTVDRTGAGKGDFYPQFRGFHTSIRDYEAKTVKFHLIIDKSSVELFADDGRIVMTEIFFPNEDFNELSLFIENGTVDLIGGKIHELKSIWK